MWSAGVYTTFVIKFHAWVILGAKVQETLTLGFCGHSWVQAIDATVANLYLWTSTRAPRSTRGRCEHEILILSHLTLEWWSWPWILVDASGVQGINATETNFYYFWTTHKGRCKGAWHSDFVTFDLGEMTLNLGFLWALFCPRYWCHSTFGLLMRGRCAWT